MKYQEKIASPEQIDAIQWDETKETLETLISLGMRFTRFNSHETDNFVHNLHIDSKGRSLPVVKGEWIIRTSKGQFYALDDYSFRFSYESLTTESGWTQEPPKLSGTYWHWDGDVDSSPLPMFIGFSGFSGKCFIQMGQLGFERAIDCDEYGGWWKPLVCPQTPTV